MLSQYRRPNLAHELGSPHEDPHLVIGRLFQQDVSLGRKEPDEAVAVEFIFAIVEQVRGATAQDEVHFQLSMCVTGEMLADVPVMPGSTVVASRQFQFLTLNGHTAGNDNKSR